MSEVLLEVRNITKRFPGVVALDDVSLSIRRGEIHGLCGENGAGKSTLIKILSGIYPQGTYEGSLRFEGQEFTPRRVVDSERTGISTIFQELSLFPKLTVGENLFIGDWPRKNGIVDHALIAQEARRLLAEVGLAVPPDTVVENLGIGHQQLVEIAKAVRRKAKLLILDEPTSALSEMETEKLLRMLAEMKAKGLTCIYISHKLEEVRRIADTISVLRDGRFIESRPAPEFSIQDLICAMVGREMKNVYPRVDQVRKDLVLKVHDWSVKKSRHNPAKLVDRVSFDVYAGEILGLAGLMGSGRTELAESLFGLHPDLCSGSMELKGTPVSFRNPAEAIQAGFAYLPEDRKRHGVVLNMGIAENVTLASLKALYGSILNQGAEEEAANRSIVSLKIKAGGHRAAVSSLSGGNQQKVVIGKWLLTKPSVLVLDEVTRGVDVGAKFEIYKIINELVSQGLAVVLISSELPELIGLCGRILVMHEGRLKGEFSKAGVSQEEIMAAAMA